MIAFSCKKEEIGPQCPTCEEEIVPTTTDILIGCEGNFGWGNASITSYNPNTQQTSPSVFQNINGFSLGDVLQNFYSWEDKLYIILNNSGKIEVVDTVSYTYQATISNLNSPRYMVVENGIGYVSDLYSNGISVLDMSSHQVTDTIQVGRWSEHLLVVGDNMYISCPDTTWVLKYNLMTAIYTDTIDVGKSPSGIQLAGNGHLWFLSSGGYNEELAQLTEYDGNTILQTLSFGSLSDNPSQLIYNEGSDELMYLNGDLFAFQIGSSSLPTSAVIDSDGSLFYGLSLDPHNSDIYITDAVDYVQQGRVFRFDSLYNPIDTFSTGIIPQAIWFK